MNRIAKFLMLAVAVVALGAATATAATLITGKQVKNKSLTGKDVKPKSLAVKHLSAKARTSLKGQAGPQGEAGPKGDKGEKGDRGPSTAHAQRVADGKPVTADVQTVLSFTVPDGDYVVQGKTILGNITPVGGTPACQIGVLRGDLFDALDEVSGLTVGPVGSENGGRDYGLLGFATLDNGTNTVELRCQPDDGQNLIARDSTLVATQVAELK